MRLFNFVLLLLIVVLVGCEKESIAPDNYMKASINGTSFLAYEDSQLNDQALFRSFSFASGKTITNETDTCFFITISASLDKKHLSISFPRPTEKTSYPINKSFYITGKASATCTVNSDFPDNEDGQEIFFTQNVSGKESLEGQQMGEIVIETIDLKRRLIKGKFSFKAYGYEVFLTETFVPTDNVVNITNGEFYYQWDQSFDF
jgi:hypothetical protein